MTEPDQPSPEPSPGARLRARVVDADEPVYGAWLTAASPELLDALAASEIDYVGIDCQHGMATEAEAASMIAAGPATASRLVRVSANRTDLIGKVADGGADGIIIPTVNSAAEARHAVEAVRFPPEGVRSFGAMAKFLPREPARMQLHALVLPMIETLAGLDAVEDILAVPGVDGIYVGPADLGIALGLGPRQFPPSAQLLEPLQRIVTAGRAAGKIVGVHAGSELFAAQYTLLGFRLITLGIERSFVQTGVTSVLAKARGSAAAGADGASNGVHAATSPY